MAGLCSFLEAPGAESTPRPFPAPQRSPTFLSSWSSSFIFKASNNGSRSSHRIILTLLFIFPFHIKGFLWLSEAHLWVMQDTLSVSQLVITLIPSLPSNAPYSQILGIRTLRYLLVCVCVGGGVIDLPSQEECRQDKDKV